MHSSKLPTPSASLDEDKFGFSCKETTLLVVELGDDFAQVHKLLIMSQQLGLAILSGAMAHQDEDQAVMDVQILVLGHVLEDVLQVLQHRQSDHSFVRPAKVLLLVTVPREAFHSFELKFFNVVIFDQTYNFWRML